jgi:DNA-binding NarL/FixJ family response regulator
MARPCFVPSAEQRRSVKAMAGLGLRHQDIALVLEISEKTLRKHFRSELTRGAIEANAKVLQTLYGMATSGENTAATIFYAKTRCGLRESAAG